MARARPRRARSGPITLPMRNPMTFDPTLALIMPAAIVLAFIAEMAVLILRKSEDYQ